MIEFPDISTFSTIATDSRFVAAIGIAILSGAARGFAGFGSALIYIPLMSAVYGPPVAAASFLAIDVATGLVFAFGVWRQANWREIMPMVSAAILAAQFGTLILQYADPVTLRWVICALVALVVPILASGWRYHGQPMLATTIGVGLVAGLIGGAAQMSGPPILLYWLGSMHDAIVLRANFIIYFAWFSTGAVITYYFHGLMTAQVIALAILAGPPHILAMWGGSLLHNRASQKTYRRVAYTIIAASAVIGAPIFDRLFR